MLNNPRTAALLVGCVVFVGLLLTTGPWPAGVFYDDGIYVILGQALSDGAGLRYLHLPGQPVATHYPPGYPLFLASLWTLIGDLDGVVRIGKLFNITCMGCCAGLVTWISARHFALPVWGAAVVGLGGVMCIPVITTSGVLLSEPLFLLVLIGALIAAERGVRRPTGRWYEPVLVGLALASVVMVRSIGVTVVGAAVGVMLLQRRWREAGLVLVGAMLLMGPWLVWSGVSAPDLPFTMQGSYGSYVPWYLEGIGGGGLIGRLFWHNLVDLMRPGVALFSPLPWPAVRIWVLGSIVAVMALGFRSGWRRAPVSTLFLGMYLIVVLVWPYLPDRFLWAVWLPLAAVFGLGVQSAWRMSFHHVGARIGQWVLLAGISLSLVGYAMYNVRGLANRWWESAPRSASRVMVPAMVWIEDHTSADDVIAIESDPMVYLYTGRTVIPPVAIFPSDRLAPQSPTDRTAYLAEQLAHYQPSYLIVASTGSLLRPALGALLSSGAIISRDTLLGGGTVFTVGREVDRPAVR